MRKRTMLLAGASAVAALTMAGCATQDAVESPASSSASPTQATPAASGSPSASDSAGLLGAESHTNNFDVFAGDGVTQLKYAWDGNYSVTSNQQSTWGGVSNSLMVWNPPGAEVSHYYQQIQVKSGRYGSTDVYDWFSQRVSQFSCEKGDADCNVTTMNFAFTGTMTVNGTDYPIVFGQAGMGDRNVWFWGGPGWYWGGDVQGSPNKWLLTPDGKYGFATLNAGLTVAAVQ